MAFWNESGLEPKRQFKFKVTFGLLTGASGPNEGIFLAQSADRPMYTVSDTTKVDYLDKSFHFPGKVTWNQVKIKFVDTTGGATGINVAQKSFDYLGQAGFLNAGSIAGKSDSTAMATISKAKATRPIQVLSVEVLNSDGGVVDSWQLNNPFITTVALNNLDYSAEGILTVEYTFRYDYATYTAGVR